MKVQLAKLAHSRSGDKGDTANVGLIALSDELYPILVREVTAERVKQHFKGICQGEVERFELEELQGVSGLKGLRVAVSYEEEATPQPEQKKETRKSKSGFTR